MELRRLPIDGFCLAALLGGLGCANTPGPQDDVVVTAPGVVATADDDGVDVRAPLGVAVKVDQGGVTVKAPGVHVESNAKGTSVNAPLGVTVRTGQATQP